MSQDAIASHLSEHVTAAGEDAAAQNSLPSRRVFLGKLGAATVTAGVLTNAPAALAQTGQVQHAAGAPSNARVA